MPSAPHDASDAELLGRAAAGDARAFTTLADRHLDAVHDHLARWSRDAALAAAATRSAFTDLLAELPAARRDTDLLPRLLAAARDAAVARLRATDTRHDEPTMIAEGVLATGATGHGAAETRAAWDSVAALDDDAFSAVDLSTRHGLDAAAVATVLGIAPGAAAALVERSLAALGGTDGGTAAAYAALPPVPAPVPVRHAVTAAADRHFGVAPTAPTAPTGAPRLAMAVVAVGVVALVGLVGVLRGPTEPADDGPPVVAAEPVDDDVPDLPIAPSAPATAEPLVAPADPSPVPQDALVAPVAPVAPVASPTPSPTPTSTPSAVPLAVTIEEPAAGTTAPADRVEGTTDRQVAMLAVAATVTGDPAGDAEVTWVSELAPDRVLLVGRRGEVALWLETPCRDTHHPLRVTVTDPATGQAATEVVQVVAQHTCASPVRVTIEQPADGATATVDGRDDAGRTTAAVAVAATAGEDDVTWQWTSDRMSGEVLLEGPSGTVHLRVDGCEPVTHVLTARAERTADGSSDAASRTVHVQPDCDG